MKCKPYKPSCCTCFFLYATGICIYIWSYLSLRQTTTVTRPAVISHLAKIIRRVNLNSTLGVPDYTETYQLNFKNIIKTSAIPFQSVSIADQINVSTVEGRSSDATKTTLKGTFTTTERRKGTSTGLATLGMQEPLEITENFTNLSKSILLKPSTRQNLKSTEKQQLSLTSLKAFGVSATVKVDNYSHTVSDTDKPGINSVAAVSASSITLSVKNVSNIDVSTSTVSSINNTKSPRTESVSNGEFGNHSDSTVGIIGTTVTADTSKIPTEIAPTTAALPSAVSLDDSKGESTELGSSSKGQEGKYPDMDFKTITSTTVPANTNPIATDDILTTTASAFTVSSNVRTDVSPTRDMTIRRSDNRLTTTRNDNVISHKNVSNTHQVYLCVNPSGRLGNLMFQFASLVGTARLHNMTPAISEGNPLKRIFNMSITELNSTIASAFPRVGDKKTCAFDPISADFSSNLTLSGFFQSWRYFSNVSSELREQFTFKVDIVKRARSALEASLYSQHRNFSLEKHDICRCSRQTWGYSRIWKNKIWLCCWKQILSFPGYKLLYKQI
ncbi:uncharacterized protein LOC135472968 isoform X2 [Liolophura sinensis]|uniref:uncharacterized protein LOC135472968 isoform X2 n=1 Tax=Liolophura sinensis TaxID=3198878 RepID=UPI0031582E8E